MPIPRFDIQQLLDPSVYPWPVDTVRLIETHISWVLLAGDRVVKLKRPVDLGFVDFRDPARRKRACEDEVRLNKRLTDGVYLGVVPITENGVDAAGEPLEWATLMRRMPADRMLDVLLTAGTAPDDLARLLAERLIPFHESSLSSSRAKPRDLSLDETQPSKETVAPETEETPPLRFAPVGMTGERDPIQTMDACPADPDTYLAVLTDNLAQVAEAGEEILSPGQLALVDRSMRAFLDVERALLTTRLAEWLVEGHGDLRCEHICVEGARLQIYDCVEFEIAIRCSDVASDLAFLCMDLRRLGAQPIADELLDRYRAAGFDLPRSVIALFCAHRALVRAKVASLARFGNDAEHDRASAFEAASYLDLASAFATPVAPMLVLVSGLSGSGKSTVAAAIGRITGGTVIGSDRVRKELAGMESTDSGAAEWHQGIYSDDWTARTYERLRDLATTELDAGRSAVVDATFLDNTQRAQFTEAALGQNLPAVIVWTELDDAIARERIERRARNRNDSSDATFTIRKRQQEHLRETPLRVLPGVLAVTIDTSADGPASRDPFIEALRNAGLLGSLLPEWQGRHA